jgi:hypothetical protein
MQNSSLCFSLNGKHQLVIGQTERLPPLDFDAKKEFFDLVKKRFYL